MQQLAFDDVETIREFGFKPNAYQEISIDSNAMDQDGQVLPIISRLSRRRDERWLTCVNTPVLAKAVARAADIAPSQLLWIQASGKLDATEVIKKALRSGRSHTVIGFCGDLTLAQRAELQQCAELADCQCLVLTNNGLH
jgi:cell division inhibitor SulA